MERRDDDLDAVVLDDPHAVEQVLLRREAAGGRAATASRQLVDELVDPARGERRRRRRPRSSCLRVRRIGYGGLDEHERAQHPVQVADDHRAASAAARRAR